MSGKIDLEHGKLRITFPYQPKLIEVVRGFQGRRWAPAEKAWYVPDSEVVDVVKALHPHKFKFAEDVRALYESTSGETLEVEQPSEDSAATSSLSVGELNRRARVVLLEAFPESVWLVGEVSGFDRWRHKKHVYFQLSEKGSVEDSELAAVSAVLFEGTRSTIERRIQESEEPFEIRDGMEIRVRVRVELYAKSGSFQVVVEDIDPVHTLGKLALRREMVLKELRRLDLVERNCSLPWSPLPLRVGLMTSYGSDAYNDFVNELTKSGYGFDVIVWDAVMQGQKLEGSLLQGLEYFESLSPRVDVLAIVRGGGSRTDLSWFDTLALARAIAESPLKVLAGIGHHRDVSVIDLIAHSEKTPTAAAAFLVHRVREADEKVATLGRSIPLAALDRLRRHREKLAHCARSLSRDVRVALDRERYRLQDLGARLPRRAMETVQRARLDLRRGAFRLARSTRGVLSSEGRRLQMSQRELLRRAYRRLRTRERDLREWATKIRMGTATRLAVASADFRRFTRRLSPATVARLLARARERVRGLDRRLLAMDPKRVLARGYCILRREDGTTVRRAADVEVGSPLNARLSDGSLKARVTEVDSEKAESQS